MIKATVNASYFFRKENDPDWHMYLLSLINIVDVTCIGKKYHMHVLAKFLIFRLWILHIDEQFG